MRLCRWNIISKVRRLFGPARYQGCLRHTCLIYPWNGISLSLIRFRTLLLWLIIQYFRRSSDVRHILKTPCPIYSTTSFSHGICGLLLFIWPFAFPSCIHLSRVWCILYVRNNLMFAFYSSGMFHMWLRVHQLWIGLFCVHSMIFALFYYSICFLMPKCVWSASTFHSGGIVRYVYLN